MHSHREETHDHHRSGKNLLLTMLLNAFITAGEVAGGILSNSLSLLSDALHNLSDTISIFIAWLAERAGRKPSNTRKTFGFRRVEILAALVNASALIAVCIYLVIEAWERLNNPREVHGLVMIVVAVIGLAGNLAGVLLLRRDSGKNINIRAAYLHLLGDTLSSVAVVGGGVLIYFFRIYWVDPVLTILISLFILKETYAVLRQVVNILMQAVPAGLRLEEVEQSILRISGVANVHHVHAWNLTDQEVHFECHIDLKEDIRLSETDPIREKIEKELRDRFGIGHTTLQFEFDCCGDKRFISH
ncbi:MAG: cation diffusion facilitator family transporter [Bacteroidales bacterium]